MKGPLSTVGRSKELKKAKEKSIKLNPMSKIAQKEAAMKNLPKRKFLTRAFIESVSDKNAPMKKARLEDSVRGKKMVFKKAGGRAGYDTGKIVRDTDTSGKPRPPQVPLNQRPEWKRRHFLDKALVERGKKRIRDGKEIKGSNKQQDLKKRKMEKFQLGKKYNIGGRAGYSTGKTVKKNIEDIVGDTATENIFSKVRTKHRKAEKQYKDIPSGMKKDPKTDAKIKTKLLRDKNNPRKEFNDTRWEVFATQRMAKGGRASYNSGGAVLKGKKVGCQIK